MLRSYEAAGAILVALSVLTVFPVNVLSQAPAVSTEAPLYTLRDRTIGLKGSGLAPGAQYFVWLMKSGENATSYAKISFLPISGGLVPPTVFLTLSPTNPLGIYLVSLSTSEATDTSVARARFGVWGTSRSLYQRTEPVAIMGGGIWPGERIRLTIRNPAGIFVHETSIVANGKGEFKYEWKAPKDSLTERYTIFIDGTGTFDNPSQQYVHLSTFNISPATLNIRLSRPPQPSYERVTTVEMDFVVKYPDGSPVTTIKQNILPVSVHLGTRKLLNRPVELVDASTGLWRSLWIIPKNATLTEEYRALVSANSFDDGFGNMGPTEDVESRRFNVTRASLLIDLKTTRDQIQLPFDVLEFSAVISYRDKAVAKAVSVNASITHGEWSFGLDVRFDRERNVWVASYAPAVVDVFRTGTWKVLVSATDEYGNLASRTFEVSAQPYLLIGVTAALAFLIGLVNWFVRRYWRRAVLRVKRFRFSVKKWYESRKAALASGSLSN